MRMGIISLLVMALAMPMSLKAEPINGLGMWVWSKWAFSTPDARQQLVQFCVKHRISHLDVHIKMSRDNQMPILQDAEAFEDLIRLAGEHNITTTALRLAPRETLEPVDGLKSIEQIQVLLQVTNQEEFFSDGFFSLFSHLLPQFLVFDQAHDPFRGFLHR